VHQLTYIIFLVVEDTLSIESVQIFLFNSQTYESKFGSAFDHAFELLGRIEVHASLKKTKINTFRNMNHFVFNKNEYDVENIRITSLRILL